MNHHYNLDNNQPSAKLHNAATIKQGVATVFRPSFERGDKVTRMFAESSSKALANGGITLAFCDKPDKKNIVRAMSILQGLLNEATH